MFLQLGFSQILSSYKIFKKNFFYNKIMINLHIADPTPSRAVGVVGGYRQHNHDDQLSTIIKS
jgi:hypothetical protein